MIDLEKLQELRSLHKTIEQIADYFEVSTTTIKRTIKANNLQIKNKDIDYNIFIDLYNKGLDDSQISEKLQITLNAARDFRVNHNLPTQKIKKREENKRKFLELYNQGYNDSEIGRMIDVNHVTIKNWREALDLPSHFQYKKKYDTEEFMKLYNQGYNYTQIASKLGVSQSAISEYGVYLGLAPNIYNKKIPTYEEEQIILGTLLGDGYLNKQKATHHANGSFAHSLAQEGYCKWKEEKLKDFVSKGGYKEEYDKRTNKTYSCYYVNLRASSYLDSIYDKFYKNNIKYINKEILYKIDALGLAVWFMDDGYKRDQGYSICTNSFNSDDLNIIKSFFKDKFNIEITIHKSNIIYIGAKYYEVFTDIIAPYIHPDCLYKLHVSHLKNSVKQGNSCNIDNPVLNLQETEENAERLEVMPNK